MTEHTPEPWEWDYDMEGLYGLDETVIWAEFDHNKQVAYVCVEEKNMPLIKAAPNLLAACKMGHDEEWPWQVYHILLQQGHDLAEIWRAKMDAEHKAVTLAGGK